MENGRKLYYPGRFPVIMGENFSLSSMLERMGTHRSMVIGVTGDIATKNTDS